MTELVDVEHKKRARRRLVGALSLVLLAAIVLPMVMDEEPAGMSSQDIQVSIPDFSERTMQITPAPLDPPDEVLLFPAPLPDAVAPDATMAPSADGHTESLSAAASSQPQAVLPPQSSPQTPSTLPPVAAIPPSASVQQREAARAIAILEGRTQAGSPTVDAAGHKKGFVVQVGAFGDAVKAASLSADLKSHGFAAYMEPAGAVTRVRVGPFANQKDAEKAVKSLQTLGMNGVVQSR